MANQEDVKLFLQGLKTWNESVENRGNNSAQNQPRRSLRYKSDLSDTWIGFLMWQRVGREENFFLEQATSYPRADFSFCDLRRTDFSMMSCGFDFREALFGLANLQEAKLTAADLTKANFVGADLQDAVLQGGILNDARLENATLTGADLSATCPWRAHLFEGVATIHDVEEPRKKSVKSVGDLIEVCEELGNRNVSDSDEVRLYYRGEAKHWKLRPSVMRTCSYRNEEGRMLIDLMTRRPQEFGEMKTALSQWVLAQHHGLKTRLLDVTRNPLVALFNTCEGEFADEEGRLHIFSVPPALMKSYDSDVVSIITNFAKLSYSEQSVLLGKRRGLKHDYKHVMGKLYHLIGEEKPHFLRRIDPRDFFRVFVVEPQQSVERLSAQSGAFLISAFHERFERNVILRWNNRIPIYEHYTLTIPPESKPQILKELRLLNITRETLFPSLDEAAKAINAQYGSLPQNRGASVQDNRPWRKIGGYIDLSRRELPPNRWTATFRLNLPEDE